LVILVNVSSIHVAALGKGIEELDARELAARLGDVERAIRSFEAVAVSIVATADRREVFREDGHVSGRGWVKASVRASDPDVTHQVRTARLCTDLPVCRDELAAGRLVGRGPRRPHATPDPGGTAPTGPVSRIARAQIRPSSSREAHVTFSTGWPIQKPTRGAGTRGGAQEAKLALSSRMDALASVPLFAGLSKRQL
jgi:hypothetical protein